MIIAATHNDGRLRAVLARVLHRPNWFRVPAWLLRLVLRGEATLLLGSRRVVPAKLTAAGFEFAYPDLERALRRALGTTGADEGRDP